MSQIPLVATRVPPSREGIDLRRCDVAELLVAVRGASLVVADPPWSYRGGAPGHGRAEDHYTCIGQEEIAAHLRAAHDAALGDAYLLLWCTFPILREWMDIDTPWTFKTGGAWYKGGALGTGYHWRGNAEPVLIYVKGAPGPSATVRNGHATSRESNAGVTHSEKPLAWARDHVRAFCPPGGLVLDLYAGMAPYARACWLEGRRYVGAEIDPERHAAALSLLAQCRQDA